MADLEKPAAEKTETEKKVDAKEEEFKAEMDEAEKDKAQEAFEESLKPKALTPENIAAAAEASEEKAVDADNEPNTEAEKWTMEMPDSIVGAAQKSSKSLA